MKVEKKIVKTPPAFEPVQLTLTFETKDELARFYALFNHAVICDVFGHMGAEGIREQIIGMVQTESIEYHRQLNQRMKQLA